MPATTTSQVESKSTPASAEPKSGDRTVIDGKPHVWIPGFGWVLDEGGGSVGTMVGNPGDQLTGHKVSIMGGGTTVDGKGDINKQVGIMDGGTIAENMYKNGHKIGILGSDGSAAKQHITSGICRAGDYRPRKYWSNSKGRQLNLLSASANYPQFTSCPYGMGHFGQHSFFCRIRYPLCLCRL